MNETGNVDLAQNVTIKLKTQTEEAGLYGIDEVGGAFGTQQR